jgi:hypothetical protein
MNKAGIETKLTTTDFDLSSVNPIQLITFIMEEIELIKNMNGPEKKQLVIQIITDFIKSDNNIFILNNNNDIIIRLTQILETQLVSDIIDMIVKCADGAININIRESSCCFPAKK